MRIKKFLERTKKNNERIAQGTHKILGVDVSHDDSSKRQITLNQLRAKSQYIITQPYDQFLSDYMKKNPGSDSTEALSALMVRMKDRYKIMQKAYSKIKIS